MGNRFVARPKVCHRKWRKTGVNVGVCSAYAGQRALRVRLTRARAYNVYVLPRVRVHVQLGLEQFLYSRLGPVFVPILYLNGKEPLQGSFTLFSY